MELDELKQQWQALNEQLSATPITDESRIEQLIAAYRTRTDSSLGSLKGLQRLSITIGLMAIPLFVAGGMMLAAPQYVGRFLLLILFGIVVIACIAWDIYLYTFLKQIRVDLMPVLEVSRRTLRLRRLMRYEVWATCLILLAAIAVSICSFDVRSPFAIALMIAAGDGLCYFYYRRFVYRHLDHIRKSLDELNEII